MLAALAPFLPMIGAALGSIFGKKNSGQQSSQELGDTTAADFAALLQIPEIRDLFKLQQAQALRQEPLSQAVNQLAFQLLPVSARSGIQFGTVPTPQLSTFPGLVPGSGSAAGLTVPQSSAYSGTYTGPPSSPVAPATPTATSATTAVRRRYPQ